MIIFGNRLFGKVDQVPGVGYVATRFFHIDYLPLVPYEGWLVFQQTGKTWRGVKIPLSIKSLLMAWGRTAGVVAGVGGLLFGLFLGINHVASPVEVGELVVLAAVGWGFFAFSKMHKGITRASYARACQLAKLAKINPQAMAALAAAYGEAPPVQVKTAAVKNFSASKPSVADEPIPLEEIPVDAAESGDSDSADEQPVSPAISQPARPLTETRRHG